jgi:hypothetical protein
VPPVIEESVVENHIDQFRVAFRVVCRQGPIDFRWVGEVTGDPDGTVTYRFSGVAHSTFLRNRIGLCVLHPLRGVRGAECFVTHPDGTTTAGRFPDLIAPHQPFRNVRAMRYWVGGGPEVEVTFAGEVFETEDHRNWIDGSYKTYGTPLELPFPVELPAGATVEQSVTIRVSALPDRGDNGLSSMVRLRRSPGGRLPRIGLAHSGHPFPPGEQVERLRALGLDHIRVGLRPGEGEPFLFALGLARALKTDLHVALTPCRPTPGRRSTEWLLSWRRRPSHRWPHGWCWARRTR